MNLSKGNKYRRLVGVGGIGSGLFFALEGNNDLGRSESRAARLIDARDYCKLHIITHYMAVLLKVGGGDFHVMPVGYVGNDSSGERLIEELESVGIDTTYIKISERAPTLFSVCYQYPDGAGGNITASNSAASLLTIADIDAVRQLLDQSSGQCIALALPEVPLDIRHHLLKLATECHALRVASFTSAEVTAAMATRILESVDLLFLNYDEATTLAESVLDPEKPHLLLERCAKILRALQPEIKIIVTAGRSGAFVLDEDEWIHSPAYEVEVLSTAGAGDALLAGTLIGLVSGLPLSARYTAERRIESAVDFGVLIGSYSTTSPHTIHPNAWFDDVLMFAKDAGVLLELPVNQTRVA